MNAESGGFADRLLAWHASHGRHDLPWKHPRTPYRVWVSEIMLQQTQVSTVIPYFEQWMTDFPTVSSLATASQDDVMSHWAGLGYYARARNLHAAAKLVDDQHDGELPQDLDALMALPGIGRSTAGAILAQAWNEPVSILDGNVKRVLTRHRAIAGWPGRRAVEKQLWQLADDLTPQSQAADYTQAIMDLGATICRRRKPACDACPVSGDCKARAAVNPADYPSPAPKRSRPLRHARMLMAVNAAGEVYLERRPGGGIWGGLWSLPEIPESETVDQFCHDRLGMAAQASESQPPLRHGFTHFEMEIEPIQVVVDSPVAVRDVGDTLWLDPADDDKPGLPAPIARLIARIERQT